jgi:dephospho-CoA kinase
MGAGKSLALDILKELGHPVADADQASREVVDASNPAGLAAVQELVRIFGASVAHEDGSLDRAALRSIVARDESRRLHLEAFLHPLIRTHVSQRTAAWAASGARFGFVEGTRLIESGFVARAEGLILVTAPLELRLERVRARNPGQPERELRALMDTQDEDLMRRHARVIWENVGTRAALEKQVEAFLSSRLAKP